MAYPRKYLFIGMSHVECLRQGWGEIAHTCPGYALEFLNLRVFRTPTDASNGTPDQGRGLYSDQEKMMPAIARAVDGKDAMIVCISGNEHNVVGLCGIHAFPDAKRIVERRVERILEHWLAVLKPLAACPSILLVPPPPIESEAHIRTYPGPFRKLLTDHPLRAADERLQLWQAQRDVIVRLGRCHGIPVVQPPPETRTPGGFLAPQCQGKDPTHGNMTYGRHAIEHVFSTLHPPTHPSDQPAGHPYAALPDYAYWKQSISDVESRNMDPVVAPRFLIDSRDAVATAGSCFAQHISRQLRANGFDFLVMENPGERSPDDPAAVSYDFSARYGNIYTSRQLLQLFDRAFGYFRPLERAWLRPDGRFCDPFRPRAEPGGFASEQAVHQDMRRHLHAVRRMFRQLDVFIFTLGLTECWISRLDGAAYPVAPGVAGGRYDPSKYQFVNLTASEVSRDLDQFLAKLKLINPGARVLLTVSPVPLVATYEPRHVLVSTTYSKAALRVAAEEVIASHPCVDYFPAYEIITGAHAAGDYFGTDRRHVTQSGVDHVMRVFMARMTASPDARLPVASAHPDEAAFPAELEAAAEAACDEETYRKQ